MIELATKRQPNSLFGVVVALVVDNKDPEGRYRVKVKYPWVLESDDRYTDQPDDADFVSNWARIVNVFAGSQEGKKFRGSFFLPEIDDEVLLAFEHGDLRRPVVIGSLWNGVDLPIHDNEAQDGKNNFRSIRSRSGHIFTFHDDHENKVERVIIQTKVVDDEEDKDPMDRDGHLIVLDHSDGAEKIQVYDRKKENYILIDSTNDHIEMKSARGDISILAPEGTVKIACKELETTSTDNTTITVQKKYKTTVSQTTDLTSSGVVTIKGSKIKLN